MRDSEDDMAMTQAQTVAAKIRHLATRIGEGFDVTEADTGTYVVWNRTDDYPIEVVNSAGGRPRAYRIPGGLDPSLSVAEIVEQATEAIHLY